MNKTGILKGRTGFMGRTRDSVVELQEIGRTTTKAALATLERLTRAEVKTKTSEVSMIPVSRLAKTMEHYGKSDVAARFTFSGSVSGVAALFLPHEDALHLAELLLGNEKGSIKRMGELERSTIAETTNITLNGCLNALSEQYGVRFNPEVPETSRGVKDIEAFLRPSGAGPLVVVVETPFQETSHEIEGTMVLALGME